MVFQPTGPRVIEYKQVFDVPPSIEFLIIQSELFLPLTA